MSATDRPHDCAAEAAPYVLGALEDHEAAAFREHLATCAICRDEVAALQAVADMLPAAAPPTPAPPELKRSVMDVVRREASLRAAAQSQTAQRGPVRVRRRREDRRRAPRPAWWSRYAIPAAGALALCVAAVVAVVALSPGGGAHTTVVRAQVGTGAGAASAELRRSGDRAELVVRHLPQAPRGHIYEVWVRGASGAPRPTSALFGVNSAGAATVDVPGGVHGIHTVMVTAEPDGGSATPTSPAVIVASLA